MYLKKDKLQHISTITHEGKVVVFGTDTEGKVFYTVKQDGFEDSYLNTPADQRTGWETWQTLEFPNEDDDPSVIEQEKAEFTYQNDQSRYLLRSRYSTQGMTAVAPVQAIAALDHIYVFRQSTSNTLLIDRFVLDGMTNKLNRKLEVRFKRSRQKHTPTKTMAMGNNGLSNVDTLDFRDANGNFFYEPTTELCLVSNLHKGWFSVVVVPTIENDVHRWHIFAYNSQTKKVELTTLRASQEGLFDLKDYTIYEEAEGSLVPKKIPGVIQRTLDIDGVSITNGLSATKYDLQQEQETQSGDTQLLRSATKLMVAIPTDKGVAALSFAIAGDGTLSEIDETPERTIARSRQREILLPLNTLDEVKALADQTPPPLGVIRGLALGTDADDAEDLVMVSTEGEAGQLANGDLVKISGTPDIRGLYGAQKIDDRTFEIALPTPADNLGYWEKEDLEEAGLIFDGMIAAYEKTADGKLRVTCDYHGLEDGDEVQIIGTDSYDNTYPVQTVDDNHFVIERRWAKGEAVNIKVVSRKRRGIVLDGVNDYIEIADPFGKNKNFTLSVWIKPTQINTGATQAVMGNDLWKPSLWIAPDNGGLHYMAFGDPSQESVLSGTFDNFFDQAETWVHVAWVKDGNRFRFYKNGVEFAVVEDVPEKLYSDPSSNYQFGKVGQDFFSGHLAEVRIWSLPQSADTIKNNMYLQLRGKEVGLEGYWRLGGLAFGKVSDFSIHGNEGTVYGDPYVSAATLSRKLASGADAVKYSNSDLFAVSQRATYEESFEFKVNAAKPVTLADLNNADGRGQGTKIFTFSHWGKTSRSANDTIAVSAVQDEFEDLGNGWYRASCTLTIPDEISLLRSFEIARVQGNWNSLEIRKHRIRLLSDAITTAKYIDDVALVTLGDDQPTLSHELKALHLKESREGILLKEKRELETKLEGLKNLEKIRKEYEALNQLVTNLGNQVVQLERIYNDEVNSPFNYYCYFVLRANEGAKVQIVYRDNIDDVLRGSSIYNAELTSQAVSDWQLWKFIKEADGFYSVSLKALGEHQRLSICGRDNNVLNIEIRSMSNDETRWKFIPGASGYYYMSLKARGEGVRITNTGRNISNLELRSNYDEWWSQWKLVSTGERTNNKIEIARLNLQDKKRQLQEKQIELKNLKQLLDADEEKKKAWELRLQEVITQLKQIQAEIITLNAGLLNAIKNIQAKPQTMPDITKDSNDLVTQGALLGFVQPVSRLHALETCEGNVQLSYFDNQGRMRQTNYDATADSRNAAFEQWIPDAHRACLNFNLSNSVLTLKAALPLPMDWSMEAWFVYPLPEKLEWNTLSRSDGGHHVLVKDGKQLGIWLRNDIQGQRFFDCGFNLDQLSLGWHHLTAVAKGDTTLFYIDGQRVGDTKAKALADAEESLTKSPNDSAAQQKLEAIKKAIIKVVGAVHTIGNSTAGQPFGKLSEVRIWGDAISEEEIAINSKTLLSGNEPGLLAYYPMSEATGVEVRDHSGNGNNGTVSGASWWASTVPIGNPGHTVMQFDGVDDYLELARPLPIFSSSFTVSMWVKIPTHKRGILLGDYGLQNALNINFEILAGGSLRFYWDGSGALGTVKLGLNQWHFISFVRDRENQKVYTYVDGVRDLEHSGAFADKTATISHRIGRDVRGSDSGTVFQGCMADLRIWNIARTQDEIQADMNTRLGGKEPHLVAYYPLNEIKMEGNTRKVQDLAGNRHGTVHEALTTADNTLPIGGDALVSAEYSTVTLDPTTKRKVAIMRRFLGAPTINGATLLPDKRIETLELKWIGNAQFAPTLLGYIEGPPPVPSENLTIEEDYNGATSVELTMSEDVDFSWNRAQDSGLGAAAEIFAGAATDAAAGIGLTTRVATMRAGFKGNFDFSYQFLNESNITSSSSLSLTDRLELRGTPEVKPHFPHLGTRFIPKNIGYALVVSAISDVFVTRLARSGKMVGYQVRPVEGLPPDVNTITFLMNPAYTMNGSLDGMTGSSATSDRFFKHVPEMRSQYGSLYPASYYRLKEAYDLKEQIEAEDKRRESYFSNFNARLLDEASLDRNIDSGPAPSTIGVHREEDQPSTEMTEEEKKAADAAKLQNLQANANANVDKQSQATQAKQAEIQSKITDQEKQVQATESFAGWQKRMEDLQIRAAKRNIVNTYVWDADGGLRSEQQSFANTVEHTIGGSFTMNAALGAEAKFGAMATAELTAQATVNLTQTMTKTEARSKGFELSVDLSGLEYKGITDYNDRPILPGEKVDRYRFMSFYLEGSTDHFQDFFNYVVDPEWLRSNDEEARALRQTQAGKPNKAWRVLHRVTYVERPALMGFGRDVRKLRVAAEVSENQALLDKIAKLEDKNQKLEEKLDTILGLLKEQK
ncbi:MAG: LamG domain-containing protein [Limnospira sp. PMC 1291.21]|uniref:LamG domain-containing protein n=1 Tax=unclassified Limnospira TaxID=2642885 RepID=UPI0028E18696|nr:MULTISPECIES: LamG-like jellyroll fold domain-containing protein [unclassified Limnospira]MDT9179729.1 LamG domain-containing protein [Limnospira sp. PMC 1238.20]MDT9194979.1 LamG domain-containing protein [Limnospira sp. PMC 1245.20]MDT9205261.1 LamG domain-containing protein [Limnospira sp. PMC 1243.20]MDT9210420.1 LamG domain-containing protein [Limnospira sp. PMC 1252.20]MDT9215498.1 LamG domain-containing protein [Limnospira sp. PMC 1256.20]